MGAWRNLGGAILLAAAVTGCAQMPPPLDLTEASAPRGAGYLLGPGDRFRLVVFDEANLTGDYTIAPDGTVAVPLIGSVPAEGTSIPALQDVIRERLANGFIKDASVSIAMLGYRPFYVLGEVAKPGEYPYSAGLTIEQAIAKAGGYTYRANRGTAFVRRSGAEGERSIKLRERAIAILPGDTLRVGERYF